MLTQEVINSIRILLNRVQLAGGEVPAYNTIISALIAEEARLRDELEKVHTDILLPSNVEPLREAG